LPEQKEALHYEVLLFLNTFEQLQSAWPSFNPTL